ncbi:uncharacterized protein LOC144439795 [Glandiceps talaboti]
MAGNKDLKSVSVKELCEWMEKIGIESGTVNLFKKKGVDGSDLVDMTAKDLISDLNVDSFSAKKIIKRRDESFPKSSSSTTTTYFKPISDKEESILRELSGVIGKEYRSLGTYLGVSTAEMDTLRESYSHDVKEQIYQILLCWIRKNPNDKNKELCAALEKCGRRDLSHGARQIKW